MYRPASRMAVAASTMTGKLRGVGHVAATARRHRGTLMFQGSNCILSPRAQGRIAGYRIRNGQSARTSLAVGLRPVGSAVPSSLVRTRLSWTGLMTCVATKSGASCPVRVNRGRVVETTGSCMSALPQKQTLPRGMCLRRFVPQADAHSHSLFDHLVVTAGKREWEGNAERFGSLEVDQQFDFRDLVHG